MRRPKCDRRSLRAESSSTETLESQKNSDQSEASLATGDRSGAPDSPIFAVFDKLEGAKDYSARRIAFDLAMHAADFALTDASRTSLVFDKPPLAEPLSTGQADSKREYADLRLFYEDGAPLSGLRAGEYPRRETSSFVWLGPAEDQREVGRFDLSRALLTASRDRDLAHLAFRFMDLALTLRQGGGASIRPAREDCRLLQIGPVEFRDDRPVLVVEFPPQHVFEEAIFGQIPQLPDVAEDPPNDRASLLADLEDPKHDIDWRFAKRSKVRDLKEEQGNPASKSFSDFCDAYAKAPGWSSLPKDQQIYIGPFALDPDAMAIARGTLNTLIDTVLKTEVDDMFNQVRRHHRSRSCREAGVENFSCR